MTKLGQGSFGVVYKVKRKSKVLLKEAYQINRGLENLCFEDRRHQQNECSYAQGGSAWGDYSESHGQWLHCQVLWFFYWKVEHKHRDGVLREWGPGSPPEEINGPPRERAENLEILYWNVSGATVPALKQDPTQRHKNNQYVPNKGRQN
jgi:hypothetical protein